MQGTDYEDRFFPTICVHMPNFWMLLSHDHSVRLGLRLTAFLHGRTSLQEKLYRSENPGEHADFFRILITTKFLRLKKQYIRAQTSLLTIV